MSCDGAGSSAALKQGGHFFELPLPLSVGSKGLLAVVKRDVTRLGGNRVGRSEVGHVSLVQFYQRKKCDYFIMI